jgi:DNA-binding beta-propeller fold protein YncE
VLSQLRKIEERFPREVVVVGVHSAKFPAEAATFNLRQAVIRHDIRHPVVNDRGFVLWRAYAVRAWPTIAIIDPDGRVVGMHAGEFDGDALADFVGTIVAEFDARKKIDRRPLQMLLERQKLIETHLSFPGKVLADPDGDRLFVADTDHHRIAVYRLSDGRLRASFGGGAAHADGPARRARFHSPQGMALRGDALFVADTENHAIRKLNLDSGTVTTVAGTGRQASPLPQAGPALSSDLNSPWDVLAVEDTLYVAMAGAHQLWALDLGSLQLRPFAGDGREALHDAPPAQACLAQPSGLATDGRRLWFVDSETSSLRSLSLDGSDRVVTHIGLGLFEFGDVDGDRATARLQHPLGVACLDGGVYVAESYNHRIKVFDLRTGVIRALAGSGEPGIDDGRAGDACFWEPGGISAGAGLLYVADTNNHEIRTVDPRTGEVRTLDLSE